MGMTMEQVRNFVAESWRIEGLDPPREEVAHATWMVLQLRIVSREVLVDAALDFTHGIGKLRVGRGMDVRVGNHFPPPGGRWIVEALDDIVRQANAGVDPYQLHHLYETLHPFMDGNGRTGRLLWAWCMEHVGIDPGWRERGFLHTFYYQALADGRR